MFIKKLVELFKTRVIWSMPKTSLPRRTFNALYRNLPPSFRESSILDEILYGIRKKSGVVFIQIGTNDGVFCDPLFYHVKNNIWKGLMIEPNPESLEHLKRNHLTSRSQITYENMAIGERGEFTLYWCKEDPGMASTNRAHVEKHLFGRGFEIRELPIRMIPFADMLMMHPDFSRANILLIDTEGWDGKILLSIDFSVFRPDLIVFEHVHIDEAERNAVDAHLKTAGYDTFLSRSDTVAINKNPAGTEIAKTLRRVCKL